jgi:RNA polymerase sigma-70 factor (ECF subfamily)
MLEEREGRWRSWMAAAQEGDAAAYEALLLELLPHIRGFVHRRLFDAEVVEDVVQTIFLSLHRARHTYRSERPFGPWLHAIARNAVIDHLRARGRRPREVSLEDDGVPEPTAPAREPVAEGQRSLSAELAEALAELPPAQREAVELLHVEGLSVAEAAEQVGVSRGALKGRAHRGYKALRARLGKAPA